MRIPERDIEPPDPPRYEDEHWIDQDVDAYRDRMSEDTDTNEEENNE